MVSTSNIMSSTFNASTALWPPSGGCQGISLPFSLHKPLCRSYTHKAILRRCRSGENILPKHIIQDRVSAVWSVRNYTKLSHISHQPLWWVFTFRRWSCWAQSSSVGSRVWNSASSKPTEEGFCRCRRNGALGLFTTALISSNSWNKSGKKLALSYV